MNGKREGTAGFEGKTAELPTIYDVASSHVRRLDDPAQRCANQLLRSSFASRSPLLPLSCSSFVASKLVPSSREGFR